MKHQKILILALIATTFLFSSCMQYNMERPEVIVDTEKLASELIDILEADQYYRNLLDSLEMTYPNASDKVQNTYRIMHEVDSMNLLKIEDILNNYGWPGKSMVGSPADAAAFLVLMHCGNPEVMKKYLPMIKKAVADNELLPGRMAFYTDRMRMLNGKEQVYGTQIVFDEELNKPVVYPIENPEKVDQRRKKAGLGPLSEYLNSMGIEE